MLYIRKKQFLVREKVFDCQLSSESRTLHLYNVICGIRLKKTSTAFTMSIQDSSSNMQEQLSWGYENTPLHIVPTLRLLLE